jgi:hypothetical protein
MSGDAWLPLFIVLPMIDSTGSPIDSDKPSSDLCLDL